MPKESSGQKDTMERVMHEYKHGELETGTGKKVKSRKQAVAIGMHESGTTNQESKPDNRRAYAHTTSKERHGKTARQEKEGHMHHSH
ncbi:DUF6496 domain-containing protein [Asticcacaulis sp. EMRT-3]|uniref:DUF6496 domain-containing protein n=1 Tax=Asticcacaulis sp. EMRT-3 TaxID=3040349 RepID=UPI0024AF8C7C|nr:DUF6496 domain-containing protein [Asticcacaulis sp. EMRT-3]MDI7774528.1 DUF6496 domain-containing protein [Asticcacaulis sp. EMRT-3]